jgi:hypothetical protein
MGKKWEVVVKVGVESEMAMHKNGQSGCRICSGSQSGGESEVAVCENGN